MEQTEFINMYIKTLIEEVTELTKTKMLLVTKEDFSKAQIDELNKKLEELEESVAKEKDDAAQVWKTALEEKDVETSEVKTEILGYKRHLEAAKSEAASLVEEKNALLTKVVELKDTIKVKDTIIEKLQPKPVVKEVEKLVEKQKIRRPKGVNTSF